MKKRNLWTAAAFGVVGALLRYWTLAVGVDDKGLYPAAHPGWIGYLILWAIAAAVFFLLARKADDVPETPKSDSVTAVLQIAAVLGIVFYAFSLARGGETVDKVFFVVGICAAVVLLPLDFPLRRRARTVCYLLPCVYLMALLFQIILRYRGEPETIRFLPQALAVTIAALALYRCWGLAVGMDRPRLRKFWKMLAGFACIAAAPGAHWMYLWVGIWILVGPFETEFLPAPQEPVPEENEEETEEIETIESENP